MRTARLVALCLATAVSCRCDERPNLVPPEPMRRGSAPSPRPSPEPESSSTPPTPPTSTPTSTSTPTETPNQPATPAPRPLPLTSAVALEPAGSSPLSATGENVVDPASTFRIDVPVPLTAVRVVLLDAGGDHVPATSTREVAATTRFDLAPAKPLVPASRYVLRVEGASGSDVTGADGTAYAPASIGLVAAGSPPPPEPPPRKKRRR